MGRISRFWSDRFLRSVLSSEIWAPENGKTSICRPGRTDASKFPIFVIHEEYWFLRYENVLRSEFGIPTAERQLSENRPDEPFGPPLGFIDSRMGRAVNERLGSAGRGDAYLDRGWTDF